MYINSSLFTFQRKTPYKNSAVLLYALRLAGFYSIGGKDDSVTDKTSYVTGPSFVGIATDLQTEIKNVSFNKQGGSLIEVN